MSTWHGAGHALALEPHRFAESMEVFGARITHVRAPEPGMEPSVQELFSELKRLQESGRVKAVVVTAVDTSTAVAVNIQASVGLAGPAWVRGSAHESAPSPVAAAAPAAVAADAAAHCHCPFHR